MVTSSIISFRENINGLKIYTRYGKVGKLVYSTGLSKKKLPENREFSYIPINTNNGEELQKMAL